MNLSYPVYDHPRRGPPIPLRTPCPYHTPTPQTYCPRSLSSRTVYTLRRHAGVWLVISIQLLTFRPFPCLDTVLLFWFWCSIIRCWSSICCDEISFNCCAPHPLVMSPSQIGYRYIYIIAYFHHRRYYQPQPLYEVQLEIQIGESGQDLDT
ncbi:hypothetical protein BXZ70DRAFT_645952 [Cristinia sonorae]|uniref:Uncharacterized protein n=1 Tax=Cristinia sonorae TaxID=1940300 RepID=A0A8K0XK59_9AGAR|nr:hypothetical protein BXZ70DRAFT_645952 [Cristinia sonorae]